MHEYPISKQIANIMNNNRTMKALHIVLCCQGQGSEVCPVLLITYYIGKKDLGEYLSK